MSQPVAELPVRDQLETRPQAQCPLCGRAGRIIHSGLQDVAYQVPGQWSFRQCEQSMCGLMWLDPMPTPRDIGKAYREYYTHGAPATAGGDADVPWDGRGLLRRASDAYLAKRFGYAPSKDSDVKARLVAGAIVAFPGMRDAVDDLACYLPYPGEGKSFLEVGFGSGLKMKRMQRLGWRVTGVELDPVSVSNARNLGLDARQGDLRQQDFLDHSFDAVYSSHTLEHLHEPIEFLRECRRVLRPGGKLVVVTPNCQSRGHRVFGNTWYALDTPRHLTIFAPGSLASAASRAGFTDVQVRTSARAAAVGRAHSSVVRRTGSFSPAQQMRTRDLLLGATDQLIEAARIARGAQDGEELILVAR